MPPVEGDARLPFADPPPEQVQPPQKPSRSSLERGRRSSRSGAVVGQGAASPPSRATPANQAALAAMAEARLVRAHVQVGGGADASQKMTSSELAFLWG